MNDAEKTKEQLLKEVEILRARLNEFESNSFKQQKIDIINTIKLLSKLVKTHEQLLSVLEDFDQPVYVCDPDEL